MKIIGILVPLYLFIGASCLLAEHDVEKIIAKQDELYRSTSSRAVMEMKIVTPNWERTLEMEAWSEGMDKTFIVINSPAKEKGTATLRMGNEMWNYLPKTDKTMKIPPSMMMSSWMGSDFTNDDLVKQTSLKEEYDYRIIDAPGSSDIVIELVPKEETATVWGKIVFAVREVDYLPVWQNFYDENGKLQRIINFKEIKKIGGRELPSVMELIPQNKEKQYTVIRYIEGEFDIKLPGDVFSLKNLQKKR